jgi:hypothetical protein
MFSFQSSLLLYHKKSYSTVIRNSHYAFVRNDNCCFVCQYFTYMYKNNISYTSRKDQSWYSVFVWNLCMFFNCLFIHVYALSNWSNYQKGKTWGPIKRFHQTHLCTCPKAGPGFPESYAVVFRVLHCLRWEVVIGFVDICGIIDHHCLNFLLISYG